jgi:hypothetical protein
MFTLEDEIALAAWVEKQGERNDLGGDGDEREGLSRHAASTETEWNYAPYRRHGKSHAPTPPLSRGTTRRSAAQWTAHSVRADGVARSDGVERPGCSKGFHLGGRRKFTIQTVGEACLLWVIELPVTSPLR